MKKSRELYRDCHRRAKYLGMDPRARYFPELDAYMHVILAVGLM